MDPENLVWQIRSWAGRLPDMVVMGMVAVAGMAAVISLAIIAPRLRPFLFIGLVILAAAVAFGWLPPPHASTGWQ